MNWIATSTYSRNMTDDDDVYDDYNDRNDD